MDLPNDILWIIINKIAQSDHDDRIAALASFRLASHELSSLATPLFFSYIWLGRYHDTVAASTKRTTKLDEILTNSNIAAWVKKLTLSLLDVSRQDSITITTILHRLPHIRTFALRGAHEIFNPRSNDLMSAIQAICRSPNLTRLHLCNFRYFPFAIITECPNLRFLYLESCALFRIDDVNPMDDTSSPQLLCLDSLDIDNRSLYSLGSRLSGADMSPANYFPQIKNLRVITTLDSGQVSFNYAWQIMLLASQTLTTLYLYENQASSRLLRVVPFDLGRLPALRRFTIQYWVSSKEHHDIYYLSRLLSPLSSTSGIEILEIKLVWGYGSDLFSSHGWSSLDELLVSDKFVSLTKVILHLRMDPASGIDDLEWKRNSTIPRIEAFFPKVRAISNTRHTLEIDVGVL